MADFQVGGPGPGRPSSGWANSEHVGHLVAFVGITEEERTNSASREKYVVAHCAFVVCVDVCKHAWADLDIGGRALAPRLLSADSEIVACRLVLGEAKGDRSAPVLAEPDLKPVEVEEVQKVFTAYGARLPSGKVVFDVDKFNADHVPPAVEAR